MASVEELARTINQRGGMRLPLISSEDLAVAFEWATDTMNGINFFSVEHLYRTHDRFLRISYINNPNIGAFSATVAPTPDLPMGQDFVGVYAGSIPAIYNTYFRLLCRKEVFPEVGNIELESPDRAYTPYLEPRAEIDGDYRFTFPICPIRLSFAVHLADSAFACLLLHEIAHLKNGHVDWLESLPSEIKYIPGSMPPQLTPDIKLKLQACEMDADSEAIRWAINMVFKSAENRYSSLVKKEPSQRTASDLAMLAFMDGPKEVIRYIVYSIYMLFRLFDAKLWTLSDQLGQMHPTWPARQTLIVRTVAAVIEQNDYYQYPVDEFVSDIFPLLKEAERHYASLQEMEVDTSRIASVWTDENFDEYRMMLHRAWAEIVPALEVFQRSKGKLAPGI